MPNPNPVQSDEFLKKRLQRELLKNSCIPVDVALAEKTIGIRLPVAVDAALRTMGKHKAAWIRETLCRAAIEQGIVDKID